MALTPLRSAERVEGPANGRDPIPSLLQSWSPQGPAPSHSNYNGWSIHGILIAAAGDVFPTTGREQRLPN